MKNSKTISLYKIVLLFLLITIGITYIRIKNTKAKNINNIVIGTISSIKETETNTQIELNANQKVLVIYNKELNFKLGDKIKVEGEVSKPQSNTIPNIFNYKKYLKSRKIDNIIKANKITLIKENKDIKFQIKNFLINHIEKYKTCKYLKTFILGDNSDIEKNTINTYQINGISHLFAVSGMHLSLFATVLLVILKKVNEKTKYLIIILIFIFFSFLTNYSPSILRALILYILVTINKVFKLNIKTIYLLIIDFILLLLYNPFYIYNIGFIFSFTISFSLILTTDIINNYNNYFIKLFVTSLISFITSIPILINNFHEINLLTPVANIVFVPLVSFIIFPMSLLTIIIKPLDNIFLLLTNILEQTSLIVTEFKLNLILSHIPWYIIIIYYITIFVFIKGIYKKQIIKIIPLIVLIIIHTNIKYFKKKYKSYNARCRTRRFDSSRI